MLSYGFKVMWSLPCLRCAVRALEFANYLQIFRVLINPYGLWILSRESTESGPSEAVVLVTCTRVNGIGCTLYHDGVIG